MERISIVVSAFNEQDVLKQFWDELFNTINNFDSSAYSFEVIFVNDGSTDGSLEILNSIVIKHPNVTAIHFSRNFGHEAAMLAGIEHSNGDAVICMDADLQHPPSCLTEMCDAFTQGYQVVMMNRNHRADAGILKRLTSPLFYWIINKLSGGEFEPNASDFFLISKRVASIVTKQYRERTRFLRGIIQSVGFKRRTLSFTAPNRAGGYSKYSIRRLFFFSLSAIASSSHAPLRIGLSIGMLFGLMSFFVACYSIIMWFIGQPFSGYTTLVVLISLGFALLFIVMGIIGEYIGYIFSEVKERPIYIVDGVVGENKQD